jgi:outer membrane cobalamin receptor
VVCCSSTPGTAAAESAPSTSTAGPSLKEQYNAALSIAQLSPQQVQQLEAYLEYLLETNKVMNLTGTPENMADWLVTMSYATSQ